MLAATINHLLTVSTHGYQGMIFLHSCYQTLVNIHFTEWVWSVSLDQHTSGWELWIMQLPHLSRMELWKLNGNVTTHLKMMNVQVWKAVCNLNNQLYQHTRRCLWTISWREFILHSKCYSCSRTSLLWR